MTDNDDVREILLADGWHPVRAFRTFERDAYYGQGTITSLMFDCFEDSPPYLLEGSISSILAKRRQVPKP